MTSTSSGFANELIEKLLLITKDFTTVPPKHGRSLSRFLQTQWIDSVDKLQTIPGQILNS